MKRTLYAVFKNGQFKEAAFVADENTDDVDRYIRKCEKIYGQVGFSFQFGDKAKMLLPHGYEPRIFMPRPSNRKKYGRDFIVKWCKLD